MSMEFRVRAWILLVLSVSDSCSLTITTLEDLGTIHNVTTSKVNIQILGFSFDGIAQINNNVPICEQFIIIRTATNSMKIRQKPKGSCQQCCKVQSKDIRFLLYTKDKRDRPVILPNKKKRKCKYLNRDTKLVIYVHGFLETVEIGSSQNIKNAYLSKENYNVIIFDWSELVTFPWYIEALANVRKAAFVLAKFLESYSDKGCISMANVQVIGFSLGAHVAGFAGKYLRRDLRIGRITGLDPAYPGFQDVTSEYKLNKNDADFVDVIHTDGGNFGFFSTIGHVDFYPNDGTYYQPGCDYNFLERKHRMYDIVSCSHNKAHEFYVESVYSPYVFAAVKCTTLMIKNHRICNYADVAYMGFAANKNNSGSYFLKTNADTPYGRSGFDIRSSDGR